MEEKQVRLDEEEEEEEEEEEAGDDASTTKEEVELVDEGISTPTPEEEEEEISFDSSSSRSPSSPGVVVVQESSHLPSSLQADNDEDDDGFASIPTVRSLSASTISQSHVLIHAPSLLGYPQTSFSPPSPPPFNSNNDSEDELPSFANEPSFSSPPPRSPFPSPPSFDADGFGGFSSPQIGGDEDDPWGRDGDVELDASGGGGWSASGGDEEEWGGGETRDVEENDAGGVVGTATGKVDEWEEASRLAQKRQARAVSFNRFVLSLDGRTRPFPSLSSMSSSLLTFGLVLLYYSLNMF